MPCCLIAGVYCTMVLVRGFQIKSISQQGSDSLSQTVFVGLLSSLIQKNVRDQSRISAIFHILIRPNQKKKGHHLDFYPQIMVGLTHKYLKARFVQQCEQMVPFVCKEASNRSTQTHFAASVTRLTRNHFEGDGCRISMTLITVH